MLFDFALYYNIIYVIYLSPYYIVLRIKLSKDKIYAMTPGPESGFMVGVEVGVGFGMGVEIRF